MSVRRSIRKGFALVEILIVVVILGILAAIVVPQFASASNDAKSGNMLSQVQTLENQFELWRARHGTYPDLATDGWGDKETPGTMIGDGYIKSAPVNPLTGGSDPADDWGYDRTDGTLTPALGDYDDEYNWDPDKGLVKDDGGE